MDNSSNAPHVPCVPEGSVNQGQTFSLRETLQGPPPQQTDGTLGMAWQRKASAAVV